MEFKFDRDANQDFLVNAKVAIIVGYFTKILVTNY
jgi:hypothetical protein